MWAQPGTISRERISGSGKGICESLTTEPATTLRAWAATSRAWYINRLGTTLRTRFAVREARGGLVLMTAVFRRSDVPHRPHDSKPGMFSNRQLGHCMDHVPHLGLNIKSAHPLLYLRMHLNAGFIEFLGQLPRFFAADDPGNCFGDVETARAFDLHGLDDDLAVGLDLDLKSFIVHRDISFGMTKWLIRTEP